MVEGKIGKAWSAGCAWQLALAISMYCIVGVGVFSLLALTTSVPLPVYYEQYRPLGMGACLGGFLLVPVGGVLAWGVWSIRRRAQRLDDIFTPLGLEGSRYLTNGRQYHGMFYGHPIQVYFYRGPTLDISLGTSIQTRLAIGPKSALGTAIANMAGSLSGEVHAVQVPSLDAAGLQASSIDPAWSQTLLTDPQAGQKVVNLLSEHSPLPPGPFEIRNLVFSPGRLLLKLYRVPEMSINSESLKTWTGDLLSILRTAESLPQPEITAQPSRLEEMMMKDRTGLNRRVMWITLAVIFGLTFFMLAAGALMLFLVIRFQ